MLVNHLSRASVQRALAAFEKRTGRLIEIGDVYAAVRAGRIRTGQDSRVAGLIREDSLEAFLADLAAASITRSAAPANPQAKKPAPTSAQPKPTPASTARAVENAVAEVRREETARWRTSGRLIAKTNEILRAQEAERAAAGGAAPLPSAAEEERAAGRAMAELYLELTGRAPRR